MIRNIRALAALAALSLTAVACATPSEEEATEVEETNQDLVSGSAYFETFEGLDGKHYFHFMAGNGENVLRSQGYTRLESAKAGAASVLANGADPEKFEVVVAENGERYFNLKAANGEIVATSQLYATASNAARGARTVRALVRLAKAEAEPRSAPRAVRFELFSGEDRQAYFRLRAGNGEILLGSEGYASTWNAKRAIDAVLESGREASRFEVFETGAGAWGVRLVAANGEVVARGETYDSAANADRAVAHMAELFRGQITVSE